MIVAEEKAMEYTVHKLGVLAKISTRALRYYDEIRLLKPASINSSGYRIYGAKEVDRLQQILIYRELGVSLDRIKEILDTPAYDFLSAMKEHQRQLLQKRTRLDLLLANVEKTIKTKEGRTIMTDKEKFEGFKQKMVEENEEQYGKEVREKYGNETVERSNYKLKNMTEEDYREVNELAETILAKLAQAMEQGQLPLSGLALQGQLPLSELALEIADLHRRWLSFYWDSYSKEAHASLAQMYVDDPRFTAYYDKDHPGTAAFLRDAIFVYTGIEPIAPN
jgi:DNA-binding transcriptional MerR regulator